MLPKKVLLVDDSRVGRRLVRRCLPEHWDEVEVDEAADGEEAVSALSRGDYDVVFLDLTMPGMDGYGVLRWLKEQPFSPIVIVVSGDIQPKAKVRAMLLGAFDFVPKPPNVEAIHDVLKLGGVLR